MRQSRPEMRIPLEAVGNLRRERGAPAPHSIHGAKRRWLFPRAPGKNRKPLLNAIRQAHATRTAR